MNIANKELFFNGTLEGVMISSDTQREVEFSEQLPLIFTIDAKCTFQIAPSLQRYPTLRHVQPGEGVPVGATARQLLARRGNEDVHARELHHGDVEMQEMRRNGEVGAA